MLLSSPKKEEWPSVLCQTLVETTQLTLVVKWVFPKWVNTELGRDLHTHAPPSTSSTLPGKKTPLLQVLCTKFCKHDGRGWGQSRKTQRRQAKRSADVHRSQSWHALRNCCIKAFFGCCHGEVVWMKRLQGWVDKMQKFQSSSWLLEVGPRPANHLDSPSWVVSPFDAVWKEAEGIQETFLCFSDHRRLHQREDRWRRWCLSWTATRVVFSARWQVLPVTEQPYASPGSILSSLFLWGPGFGRGVRRVEVENPIIA